MKQVIILACAIAVSALMYFVGKTQYIRGQKLA